MARLLAETAARKPGAPALVDEVGTTTWAALQERTNRLINALRAAGLRAGDTVALLSGNRREYFEVMSAGLHAGLFVVPVNWHWVARELAYVHRQLRRRRPDRGRPLPARRNRGPAVARERTVPAAGGDDGRSTCRLRRLRGAARVGFRRRAAGSGGGRPDVLHLGHHRLSQGRAQLAPARRRRSSRHGGPDADVARAARPSEPTAWRCSADLATTARSGRSPCCPSPRVRRWSCATASIRRRRSSSSTGTRVTNLHLVPTQFIRMLKLPDETRAAFRGDSLVAAVHGAAPCPPEVKRQMLAWWGPRITEYYGGTEGGFLSVITGEEWLRKPGSVGRATPLVELFIVKDDGTLAGAERARPDLLQEPIGRRLPLSQGPAEDGGGAPRAGRRHARRHRLSRRGRLSLPERSEDRHDHLGRRQHLPGRDRERARHAPGGGRRGGLRRPERRSSARR